MRYIFFAIAILSLVACTSAPATPSERMVQTAIAQTQVAQPLPSNSPVTINSPSPPPINTQPAPTATLLPTDTPKPVNTDIPEPINTNTLEENVPIEVENVKDLQFFRTLWKGQETIVDIAISPDDSIVGLISFDGLVELVRISDGTILNSFKVERLFSADFSNDLKLVVIGLVNGGIQLWDTSIGTQLVDIKPHTLGVTCIAFSYGGGFLASGSLDQYVRVWRVKPSGLEELYSWDYHPDTIRSMAFENQNFTDTQYFRSPFLRYGSGKVEYVTQDQYTHGIESEYESKINRVLYSPDNKNIALAVGNSVILWKNEFPRVEPITLDEHEAVVFNLTFSPDSRILVSATGDRKIWIWDAESGQLVRTIPGYFDAVFANDRKMLLLYKENQGIELWQITQ